MEFHIRLEGDAPDVDALGEAIRRLDPAALVDIDPAGQVVRVAAALRASELVRTLDEAGWPVPDARIRQLPSICCGGCSG